MWAKRLKDAVNELVLKLLDDHSTSLKALEKVNFDGGFVHYIQGHGGQFTPGVAAFKFLHQGLHMKYEHHIQGNSSRPRPPNSLALASNSGAKTSNSEFLLIF